MQQVTTRHVGTEFHVYVDEAFHSRHPSASAANDAARVLRSPPREAAPAVRAETVAALAPEPAGETQKVTRLPIGDLLAGATRFIEAALATGDWDDVLGAITAAEAAGKGRKSVIAAIETRRRTVEAVTR